MMERKASFLFVLILFISLGDQYCHDLGFRAASAESTVDEAGTFPLNGTFGESIPGDDFDGGEFLRHYAAGGRWLLQSSSKISYNALQKGQVCNTPKYSDCIVRGGGRPCADYNRCKRAPG